MDFQFTTILNNGFEYFVHVDDDGSHGHLHSMNCTLVQVSDRSVLSRNFHFPPIDKDEVAFFENLKDYKNVNVKKTVCTKHLELALAHIQEEIKILSFKVVATSAENKHSPSKQVVDEKKHSPSKQDKNSKMTPIDEIDLLPMFQGPKYQKPKTGDNFTSQIDCAMTKRVVNFLSWGYTGVYIPNECLKSTKPNGETVTGKITAVNNNDITFTLKDANSQNVYPPGYSVPDKFTIPYNETFTIWRNYKTNTSTRRFKLNDAGGGGNCFFFSLYEALKAKNLLAIVYEKGELPLNNQSTKDHFNNTFRFFISQKLKEKLKKMVENYKTINSKDVNLIKTGLSNEFISILDKAVKNNEPSDTTVLNLQKAVNTSGTYVSEIEVQETIKILNQWGITLVIVNDPPVPDQDQIVKLDSKQYTINDKTIILANLQEGHYQWLDPVKSASGGTRRLRRNPRRSQRRQRRQTKFNTAQ